MTVHIWPEPGDHLWGPWFPKDRKTKWRQCLHPDCNAVDTLDVSKAPS